MNIQIPETGATSATGQLVNRIEARSITARDRHVAALFTLDAVANMVAGRNSVPGKKLLGWYRSLTHDAPAEPDAARQALLLGALCHILEVDDLHRASVVHPGCVVVPGALTLAGGHTGHDVLDAVIKGFEACCRIGMCVGEEHYKIWHNTATCGPFGSAMAAASLLKLTPAQTVHALGNAGSQSGGLWQFLDSGAETKHLHAGRAAESGLLAAMLAARDFTGAPDILEGERGFYAAFCPDARPANLLPDAGDPWQVHATSIKPWPSCRHTHPAIDCALSLHADIGGRHIRQVDVRTYRAALDLCDRTDVTSPYAAKFSLQHCVAAALGDGQVDFKSFEAKARSELADLRSKVRVENCAQFSQAYPRAWGASIEVVYEDGTSARSGVECARGDPEAPLPEDELVCKAESLMRHGGIEQPQDLIAQILRMKDGEPAPSLAGLLRD